MADLAIARAAPARALPTVRLALPTDEEDIIAMCRRLHAENGAFALNEDKVRALLHRYFDRQGAVVGVIGAPGHLEASTCSALWAFYYTDDLHLDEHWNYVDVPYRRSRNAEALIEFNKEWARKLKVPLFTGIITNKQMAGKVRLYRRLLGYPAGAFFLYNHENWTAKPMADYGDLKNRLRQAAHHWATHPKASHKELQQIASLLREAADVLSSEGNIWSGPSKIETAA